MTPLEELVNLLTRLPNCEEFSRALVEALLSDPEIALRLQPPPPHCEGRDLPESDRWR